MTPEAALKRASAMLETSGCQDSVWQARVLMAYIFQKTPSQLHFLQLEELSFGAKHREESFFSLVKKRLAGVPLQHVIGEWDFYGRTFRVDHRALIPRPETELLVEFVCSSKLPSCPAILDVGTGSGVIGISLALEIPGSSVTGTDISPEAIELAEENCRLLGATGFSTVICNLGNIPGKKFDVVAANLPYIPSGDIPDLSPEVKNYDPLSALDGGSDGTLFILELVKSAPDLLYPGGLIVLETGYDQKESVLSFFSDEFWKKVQTHEDLAGNHRLVTARRI